jgi:hypothetical protein
LLSSQPLPKPFTEGTGLHDKELLIQEADSKDLGFRFCLIANSTIDRCKFGSRDNTTNRLAAKAGLQEIDVGGGRVVEYHPEKF